MPLNPEEHLVIPSEVLPDLSGVIVFAIARLISTKKIDPSEVTDVNHLSEIVEMLGRESGDAFEIHIDRFTSKFAIIRECLAQEEYESAALVLFTVVEGEINTAIRIILRIRNFSHGAITDAIKGMDIKSKLDVLLPLLGVAPSARFRQFARQSQKIRNLVVHFRANPEFWDDSGIRSGDYSRNLEEARGFFSSNPVNRLERDISEFVELSVWSLPEVQDAFELVGRFQALKSP